MDWQPTVLSSSLFICLHLLAAEQDLNRHVTHAKQIWGKAMCLTFDLGPELFGGCDMLIKTLHDNEQT